MVEVINLQPLTASLCVVSMLLFFKGSKHAVVIGPITEGCVRILNTSNNESDKSNGCNKDFITPCNYRILLHHATTA